MKFQFSQVTISTFFTLCVFSISQQPVQAAPGSLGQIPLFVAPPTQPNIFFMLDDSGSMGWNLRATGAESITFSAYVITPGTSNSNWRTWCLGANALGYNPTVTYKPWAGNTPITNVPYPDQTDITKVWAEPTTEGGTFSTSMTVNNNSTGSFNLSDAPVVLWTDSDNDGLYDANECPYSYTDVPAGRVRKASTLLPAERTNFANWFTYYRDRDRAVTAAVTQVVSTSSARMGMGTLNGAFGRGKKMEDMTVLAKKDALLSDIALIRPWGGTPLQASLNRVGLYFDVDSSTPSALNISTAVSDKPILSAANGGECQQNFAMLMTDGYGSGNAGVGHQDKFIDEPYVYKAHKDNSSNRLADVAMKWYREDLAPALANKVPVQSGADSQNLDGNNKQHLVTFTVAFGLSDSLTDPTDRNSVWTWPSGSLADMRHAAYNGRGKFLSAGNPEVLISSLQNIISDIESRQGSSSAVSFNTSTLQANTSLFFASFNTEGWTGDLSSFTIDEATGVIGSSQTWSAAAELDSLTNTEIASRTIYTWGMGSLGTKNGVLFNWNTADPQPAIDIQNDLKINPDLTIDASPFTGSQTRLAFLRGDTSVESDNLIRNRNSRLGDIIHSAPIYVGASASNWPDSGFFGVAGDRYSSYEATLLTSPRTGVVYVGANDGLLHGFKESDGTEMLAYLPSALSSSVDNKGFHYLTEIDYQHRYYVDGVPVSADVYIPIETSGTREWRTILVGGLGGGGQGLFALNVTNPSDFTNTQTNAERTVLWEFTNQDDSHLGYSFSTPQITMMNNGQWVAVIGNGYNASGTDTAELIILFIEKGLDGTWTINDDYIRVDTGVGTSLNKNGLSTPTLVDLDDNGTTDRIYAGDLHGNMWAFDVSDSTASNWEIAHTDSSTNPAPLFTATHHAGSPAVQVSTTPQPITMKPLVIKPAADWIADDSSSNAPNFMVYFGTGQYVATGDATDTNHQTFYGVWDAGIPVSPTQLVEQTFITNALIPIDNRVTTSNPVTYPVIPTSSSTELGWFINLPETGERVVVDAFEHLESIFFNTMTPSSSPCSAGGESWLMATDMKTGGNPTIGAFDINGDRVFDDADKVSDGSNDYFVAGVKFAYGVASSTAKITNTAGKSFAYISGTGVGGGTGGGSNSSVHLFDLNTIAVPIGKRRSWIQLFN